jgi:hypothetical protein
VTSKNIGDVVIPDQAAIDSIGRLIYPAEARSNLGSGSGCSAKDLQQIALPHAHWPHHGLEIRDEMVVSSCAQMIYTHAEEVGNV